MTPEAEVTALDFGFVFSRFINFYHMSDERVMAMPARRFWAMEGNINRIMAERDLRQLNVNRATTNTDAYREVTERLAGEIGETARIRRSVTVQPEPGHRQKMLAVMGGR